MLGTNHLTAETAEQLFTYPGQAHFAILGSKSCCFECNFWDGKSDKQAICLKAAMLFHSNRIQKVPRLAKACKYFEPRKA